MKELLELKSVLDSINPDVHKIPIELLDELNEKLQYALGWCEGWLTQRALDGVAEPACNCTFNYGSHMPNCAVTKWQRRQ